MLRKGPDYVRTALPAADRWPGTHFFITIVSVRKTWTSSVLGCKARKSVARVSRCVQVVDGEDQESEEEEDPEDEGAESEEEEDDEDNGQDCLLFARVFRSRSHNGVVDSIYAVMDT